MRSQLTSTAVLLALAASLAAQSAPVRTVTVTGRVIDPCGRPLAGVTVSLSGVSSTPLTTRTDAGGSYRFEAVPENTYSVAFQAPGFKKAVRTNVVLRAPFEARVDVWLEPAQMPPPTDPAPAVSTRTGATFTRIDLVLVCVQTPFGDFNIAVDVTRAPVTAANFLKYVDAGLYDGGRFHRATRPDNYKPAPPNRPAMELIQGGINPEKKGLGFPPIPLERTSVTGLKHVRGVVSMARGGPDTATSDFFILLDDQPSLDFGGLRFDDAQGAAAFGTVVAGLDVVAKIQQQPVQAQNLSPPVAILSVKRIPK